MKYPKPFMNKKELLAMGIPESYLLRAIATPGQTFALRANPANRTSPIIFDTVGFEEWRLKDAETQGKARTIRTTVA